MPATQASSFDPSRERGGSDGAAKLLGRNDERIPTRGAVIMSLPPDRYAMSRLAAVHAFSCGSRPRAASLFPRRVPPSNLERAPIEWIMRVRPFDGTSTRNPR